MGEIPLMTTNRFVRHQRYRACHRLAAAPLARASSSSTTAARPIVRASCCSRPASFPTAVLGWISNSIRRTSSFSASTAAARCRSPPAQGDRHDAEQSCAPSSTSILLLRQKAIDFELVPERLRGEVARFDFCDKSGKVIVAKDKRITAKHIRDLDAAGIKRIAVPEDFLSGVCWRRTSSTVKRAKSGQRQRRDHRIPAQEAAEAGVEELKTLYTNDLDRGAFISNTCAPTKPSLDRPPAWPSTA